MSDDLTWTNWTAEWRKANPEKVWAGGTSCHVCYWPARVQAGTFDDVVAALNEHVDAEHPDWIAWSAVQPPLSETMKAFWAKLHADCNHRAHPCPCICGCEAVISCDCTGQLCSVCVIRIGREDDDHGYPAVAAVSEAAT